MVKVRLETSREHVAELARLRDPVGAVEELIWNSVDADAGHIVVTLERNDLGGVDRVRVQDDGSGMSAEHCEEYFRPIGASWKKRSQGSPVKKRALHGKNGRGRVRAFALGTQVRWTSVSDAVGGRQQLVIEADRRSMDEFDIGDPEPTDDSPGTLFEAFGGDEQLNVLADDRARSSHWASHGPLAEVLAAARDQLKAHFRARVDERRREQVAEWRREGIYPYANDAANEKERAERETFDAVATTIFRHLPRSQGTRRTTFALLRSVLAHEPSDVLRIADDLFSLSKQEREELNRLLQRTTLSALIKASTAAANRIDFLAALEHLVFAPEAKQRVTERDELHRILEDQCWVFGEEYALHVSDRSLNAVLAEHCRLLGRDTPAPEPVLREDGRSGRVDLMLSRAARHRKGERHHLVVELKRPTVVLGMTEFGQINSYAEAVMSDDRFREPAVTWDFWLVGNAMDRTLRQMAHQMDRVPGCAVSNPRFRIMVKTWGEIVEDCQERLRFHSAQLEYQSSTEHAMDYLVRNHGDTVAELVANGTVPAPRRDGQPSTAYDTKSAQADGVSVS